MRKNLKKLLVLFLAVTLIFCSGCGTTSLQPEDEAQSDSNNEASQGEKGNNEVEQAQEVAVEDDAGNEKDRSVDIAYPEDTITIVCSWAAGGQADVACRLLADLLAEELGTSIIVENVTGTGGQVAAIEYMDAPTDGYTLLYSSDVIRFLAPRVAEISYDPEEMIPLCTTCSNCFGVIVNPASGITNLDELKDYADENGPLNCGVTGKAGAITYEMMNALFKMMDIDVEYMVFESGAVVANEVVGGHVDVGIAIDPLCDQFVQEGSVNYIASFLEDGREIEGGFSIPSCIEQGYELSNADPNLLCARTGTDQTVIDKLSMALDNIKDDFAIKCEEAGLVANMTTGSELESYLDALDKMYAEMAGMQ
ncbi:MAG: hypothetical protein HFI01_08390 [Lachnospiraceae bacterium]|nr:hypothetical protein [Lachnospiraceae bacterium]